MTLPAAAPRPGAPDLRALISGLQHDLTDWLPRCLVAAAQGLEGARQRAGGAEERVALGAVLNALQAQRDPWSARLLADLHAALDADVHAPGCPAPGDFDEPSSLTLMAEDVVDEEIAASRLVQQVESVAEQPLRELASRCSSLRGWPEVSADAHPLRPQLVARALRSTVGGLGLPPLQRVALLRELATAVGAALPRAYGRELDTLRQWGVEQARFKLRLADTALRPASAAAEGPAAPPSATAPAGVVVAPELIEKLLAALLNRSALNPGSRELIRRLDAPARRLAAAEPELLAAPDHPLWQLLDRLATAGAVHDDLDASRPGPIGAVLEKAVQTLERADPPSVIDCVAALEQVDNAVDSLLQEQARQVHVQAQDMAGQGRRDDDARRLREQLVQQVRANDLPPVLGRFLLGPWAQVLTHSAQRLGADSPQAMAQVELVDTLCELAQRPQGQRASVSRLQQCLMHARVGLEDSGFDAQRVQAELADLKQMLVDPWTRAANEPDIGIEPWHGSDAPAFAPTQPMTAGADLALHEALPTVPLDLPDGTLHGAGSGAQAWLDGLTQGSFCRMHLMGQWMNTRLVWCSDGRGMFVFASRHGGRLHSLSRRSLHKLRDAGLATSIESGQLVAQAMAELARG